MNVLKYVMFSLLLAGCASSDRQIVTHTEYVVLIPETIKVPDIPKLKTYDSSLPLTSDKNFKIFQTNHLELVDYIIVLRRSLEYYEKSIGRLEEYKSELEKSKKEVSDKKE